MNRENLQRIADSIPTIPEELFDMETFRYDDEVPEEPICSTVGCVIGHAPALDPENIRNNFTDEFGYIDFKEWSENFTWLPWNSDDWNWCFASEWSDIDNTLEGARKRILYLLDHGRSPDEFNPYYIYPEIVELYAHY